MVIATIVGEILTLANQLEHILLILGEVILDQLGEHVAVTNTNRFNEVVCVNNSSQLPLIYADICKLA